MVPAAFRQTSMDPRTLRDSAAVRLGMPRRFSTKRLSTTRARGVVTLGRAEGQKSARTVVLLRLPRENQRAAEVFIQCRPSFQLPLNTHPTLMPMVLRRHGSSWASLARAPRRSSRLGRCPSLFPRQLQGKSFPGLSPRHAHVFPFLNIWAADLSALLPAGRRASATASSMADQTPRTTRSFRRYA